MNHLRFFQAQKKAKTYTTNKYMIGGEADYILSDTPNEEDLYNDRHIMNKLNKYNKYMSRKLKQYI